MNAENVHVAQKGENILNEPAALGQPLSLREVKKKPQFLQPWLSVEYCLWLHVQQSAVSPSGLGASISGFLAAMFSCLVGVLEYRESSLFTV